MLIIFYNMTHKNVDLLLLSNVILDLVLITLGHTNNPIFTK